MQEGAYWLGWQILLPGMAKRIWDLVERFGSPVAAWMASEAELIVKAGFSREAAAALVKRREGIDLDTELERLHNNNIKYITYNEPEYPGPLRTIYDPPPGLFIRGTLLPTDELAVAMVGTRRPTPYGQAVAEQLGKEVAQAGVTIISGMARGIDTCAHRGAIAAGGRTVAVLGCGIDVIYPKENRSLMEKIISTGAVITEFPPGSPPEAWHFPVRNRIISGMARATVVIEAGEKSGALITADYALEQGREVLAVPGNISSLQSRGPNWLIKQGARLVEGAEDVLEEVGIGSLFSCRREKELPRLTAEEEAVYRLLSHEPVCVDDLIARSKISAQEVLAALIFLEMKGLARQLPGRFYALRGL